jgi:rare lipoprotein A
MRTHNVGFAAGTREREGIVTAQSFTTRMAAGLVLVIGLDSSPTSADGTRTFSGFASHYGKGYKGNTAAGDPYDPDRLTAAHRTLPFGTRLHVTELKTQRTVTVVVNDRGPFVEGRVLDLSLAAAKELGMVERGIARVKVITER